MITHNTWKQLCAHAVLTAGFIMLAISPAGAVSGYDDEVLAIDYAWTSEILDRDPKDRLHGTITISPLNLWIKISGDEKALLRLSREGLPLRHVWHYFGKSKVFKLGDSTTTDEISTDVAKSEALSGKLMQEVRQKGKFDWRSWSRKENLYPGQWGVRLFYANGARVRCLKDGEVIDDCMIAVKVGK